VPEKYRAYPKDEVDNLAGQWPDFAWMFLTIFFHLDSNQPGLEAYLKFKQCSLMLVPDGGRVRSLRIGSRLLGTAGLGIVFVLTLGVWGGWQVWQGTQKDARIHTLKNQLSMLRERFDRKAGHMQARMDAQGRKLAVYARNIGNIQARLARLDALGLRLVDVASLDASEFNFGIQPAYGGPRIAPSPVEMKGLDTSIDRIDIRLADVDAQLAAIDYLLEQQRTEQIAKPHAWPTEKGWISSRYGMRADPFTGERELHRGVDIANRFGAPVLAASHGIVTFAGKMKGFGYMVEVDHGYGYITRYGHLSTLAVHAGDEVGDSQLLGRIGSTGRSTGPHLHYEVHRYGRFLNPVKFLPRG